MMLIVVSCLLNSVVVVRMWMGWDGVCSVMMFFGRLLGCFIICCIGE